MRKKGFMSFDTYIKCIQLYKFCGNESPLVLHNFGEVLLHPKIEEFISYANQNNVECTFFTNGINIDKKPFDSSFWKQIGKCGLKSVNFSSHFISLDKFQKLLNGFVQIGRVFNPHEDTLGTWAGQTGKPEIPINKPCIFERENAFVVLWNGRISSCCLDVEGVCKKIWIDDILDNKIYEFQSINLCNTCSSMRHYEKL